MKASSLVLRLAIVASSCWWTLALFAIGPTSARAQHGDASNGSRTHPSEAIATEKSKSPSALPAADVERVRKQFADHNARYMEQNCEPAAYANWENFPLRQCRYTVTDKAKSGQAAKKTATVIMLNASPEQLASWVVATCLEITGRAEAECTGQLFKRIQSQSGAQFVIAGVVLEDQEKDDGIHEAYAFRDGVTVKVQGLANGSTAQPTAEQIESALHGEVQAVRKFARIQGTTVGEYNDNGGKEEVGTTAAPTLSWLKVVRESYQKAWGNERNELMIAWAKDNLKGRIR